MRNTKKWLVLLLTAAMLVNALGVTAMAAENEAPLALELRPAAEGSMLQVDVLAVQSGFTSAPVENGSLIAANPATSHALTGPMSLGGASVPVEPTQTGFNNSALVQAVTDGALSKLESQGHTPFTKTEEYEQYAPDENVTFIVVTEDAPLLEKFSAGDIAAQTVSVNAHKATQETTLNAVKHSAQRILGKNMKLGYTVDLETADCTVVGTYGPGGQTSLFVPNDLESDLFTMGVVPTNMQIDPQMLQLVEGQTKRLGIKWTPWNAKPVDVTWASENEMYGFDVSLIDGATDFSYDSSTDLFYITDAGHNIYTMDWSGNVESVDILGSGIDMNGLAIFPAAE